MDVRGLRREITKLASHVGLNAARTDDFVLAVNEVATNSIRHGGGRGTLRAWIDSEAAVCDISDAGVITDPLVGRRRPASDAPGGGACGSPTSCATWCRYAVAPTAPSYG